MFIQNISLESTYPLGFSGAHVGVIAGMADKTSVILNCHIENAEIFGTAEYSGSFCGTTSGTIENCSTKNVTITADEKVGGLVGKTSSATIKSSFFEGNIISTGEKASATIGGLVGLLADSSTIDNSFSRCNFSILKENSQFIGGICGLHTKPTITNVYFVGDISSSLTSQVLVSGITRNSNELLPEVLKSSYFDNTVFQINSTETQARTTEEMYKQATFEGWDFENIWSLEEGKGYPKLRNVGTNPVVPEVKTLKILLAIDEEVQLSLTKDLSLNHDYTWTSSNEAVATVGADGKVTAIGEGITKITVTDEDSDYTDFVYVLVKDSVEDIRLALYLTVGKSKQLFLNDDFDNITWSSMDGNVVTVSDQGKVTAVGKGLAIVKAEYEGETYLIYARVV